MAWLSSWESFLKVAEYGSMAAAARRLDCTRAQVSKQIGELERAFGVRLFERSTRKLNLTPAGEVFHQHAWRALEAIRSAEVAVKNQDETPRGKLRISAPVVFGRSCVAPLIPQLLVQYPELECELILTDQLVDLAEDRIDLALRLTKTPPEDAISRQLLVVKRVICGAPDYLASHGTPRTPADLARHRCFSFLLADQCVWHLADRRGTEFSVPVSSRFQFNNIGCILDAVRRGHGLAILPTYLCSEWIACGELSTVLDDFEPLVDFGRNLYACYLPSRAKVPKVQAILAEFEMLLLA